MPRRFGRPGLLGTMARTAVITGTANATANAMNRRQAARMQPQAAPPPAPAPAAPPPAAAPAAPAAGGDDMMAKLQQLADLHASGILTDDEFAAAKAKLLA